MAASDYSPTIRDRGAEQAARVITVATSDETDRPDYVCDLVARQADDVAFVDDLMGGTKVFREGGAYLPQHPGEETDDYQRRLARSVLFNAYRRTVRGLVGLVFRRDMIVSVEEGSDGGDVADHLENVDLHGRNASVFARDVLEGVVNHGHGYILVDAPPSPDGGNGRSLAEVRAEGRRPYWVHIPKQDVLNIQWDTAADGSQVVTLLVYLDETNEAVGEFGSQSVLVYRVLRRTEAPDGTVTVTAEAWQEFEAGDGQPARFEQVQVPTPYSIDTIPLVPVYSNRLAPFESSPPLLDLAYENVEHYQVRSDHRFALTFASLPIPVFIGQKKKDLQWGANRAIFLPDPAAKAQMLESSGAGLAESRAELRDIEARMTALGLQMLVRQGAGNERTATETVIDKAETDSELAAIAKGLQDALAQALEIHYSYLDESVPRVVSLEVNTDFADLALDPQTAAVFIQAVEKGLVSAETMWAAWQSGDLLPEDFDPEVERERIDQTNADQMRTLAAELARIESQRREAEAEAEQDDADDE